MKERLKKKGKYSGKLKVSKEAGGEKGKDM
jgi:hypothetical protein